MKLTNLKPRIATIETRRVKATVGDSWRTGTESSTARGYGYKWQMARKAFLEVHPLCRMCMDEGRVTVATVVDHSVPHRGDMNLFWDKTKWQSLCASHHSSHAQKRDNKL